MVRPGLEVLIDKQFDLVRGKRVGLITNHTSVDRLVRHSVEILLEAGVNLVALFGPEHGIRGEVADGVEIDSTKDARTGIPVFSLYGKTHKPTPEMLDGVDLLLYDLQEVGARFYTYIYTMSESMGAAADAGIPFVVLDRPTPLGGIEVEGPVLEPEVVSFIGKFPIPNRHGMTMGELARMFQGEWGVKGDLTVVPAEGWKRSMWFDETHIPWVIPSPNMPTLDTALVYPGTCVFEGTWCSEGRGTGRPFETIGAPWMDNQQVAREMNALDLPGVRFREAYFTPNASKFQGESCRGVQIHVTNRNAYKPVRTGLHLLSTIRRLHLEEFEWRVWTPGQHYSVDKLWGTTKVRHSLDDGVDPEKIIASWQDNLAAYDQMRRKYFLYE